VFTPTDKVERVYERIEDFRQLKLRATTAIRKHSVPGIPPNLLHDTMSPEYSDVQSTSGWAKCLNPIAKCMVQAAILGRDGSIWASINNFGLKVTSNHSHC
jgi:hypothetical protein